jgi:hypothetical protein
MKAQTIITAITAILFAAASTAYAEVRHYKTNEVNLLSWAINDSWEPEGFDKAIILKAPLVKKGPAIDGLPGDAVWAKAESLKVPLAYGPVKEATIKAVHTEKAAFLLVRDDQHHPWVWDAEEGRYVEGQQVEDSLLVSFEAGCEWTPSLLSGYVYDFDGWRWLAARSNPIGQAIDTAGHVQDRPLPKLGFVKYKARATKPSWQMKFDRTRPGMFYKTWQELKRIYFFQPISEYNYVVYKPDGTRPYRWSAIVEQLEVPAVLPKATSASSGLVREAHADEPLPLVPQFKPVKLTGDAGEVKAKGVWADGRWTVEFRRALVTPARTRTDVILERITQFSIHIFDHTERVDEASESGRLWLHFVRP